MLTSQQALAQFDFHTGRIHPDRLTQIAHRPYVAIAEQLLQVYRNGIGMTRQQLHQRVQAVFEDLDDCPLRRIAAFIKLLDDGSQFETDKGRAAAKLRRRVFQLAAVHHPLVEVVSGVFGAQQWEIKHQIARELKIPWPQLERKLFSDVTEFHTLQCSEGYASGLELLARYNVAQLQASLYRAVRMTIWARSDLKAIVRLVKLSRLMHTVTRLQDGTYQFFLNGPASALRATQRYGVAMAKMIPGLLACRNWRLSALVEVGVSRRRLTLQISSQDGFSSPKSTAREFDSAVEADLMQKWNEVSLPGWILEREGELLVRDQTVFTPDFVARHDSGKQVYVEVIGYWTPEYLKAKLVTLRRFSDYRILVIAQENARPVLNQLPAEILQSVIWYKTRISIQQFHAAFQKFSW